MFEWVVVLALLLFVVGMPPAFAEEGEHESTSEHEGAHEFHPNMLALFVGNTHEERRKNGFALGLEYERRLNQSFGIGLIAEHT